MTEGLFEGVAADALAAAEEQQATKAAQREAAALEVAEKARLREEGLAVFRVVVDDASEASALFDARRRDVYAEAYRLHEEHGVSWKDLAAVAGKTPEALIKGSNARNVHRPVTVEGLPQGWVLLTSSRGQGFGISVGGVEYRNAAVGLEKVMKKTSYHFSTLTMQTSVTAERHNAAVDQITLTDEQHAKLTKALTAIRTAAARRSRAADKRSQEAKAKKKRRQ